MFCDFFSNWLGRETLVAADDNWALLAIMCLSVSAAIYLEQTYSWASKVSGVIIALVLAMILSNLGIIPVSCVLYDDIVWGFAVPMGIPLLLIQCNIKKIWSELGKMLIIFALGTAGTSIGAVLSYKLLAGKIPMLEGITGMMTGTYIGGSVNLAALADEFQVGDMVGPAIVADNLLMTLYFFALIAIGGMAFFRKRFPHPHIDEFESVASDSDQKTLASAFWKRKDISIKDIAYNFALSIIVVFVSKFIAAGLSAAIPTSNGLLAVINTFFGSQYVWITTVSMLIATFGAKQVSNLNGSQEIGTYLIYLFLFVIGVPASIVQIVTESPLLLLFAGIIVATNMVFCFVGGRIFKFDLEVCILTSNACIGGPTTAAGMAISQGWNKLVGPIMLIGTLGYVVGTYMGIIIGSLVGA